jgi:hypothetical protein
MSEVLTGALTPGTINGPNAIIGRCSHCVTADQEGNQGTYGWYLNIDNCNCIGTNDHLGTECSCDITINVKDKRHVCKQSNSIFNCLYLDPVQSGAPEGTTTNIYYTGNEIFPSSLYKESFYDEELEIPIQSGWYYDTEQNTIQAGEVMVMLQRFADYCVGQSDTYTISNNIEDPGCLPYSNTILTNNFSAITCNDGDNFGSNGIPKCCNDDPSCNDKDTSCNPCAASLHNIPLNDTNWKEDLCYFFCPSYWTQRQFLQEEKHLHSDEEICSSKYKLLCDAMGCDTDPACRIRWGGCPLDDIDMDICNGGEWSPNGLGNKYNVVERCNPVGTSDYPFPSTWCTNKGYCNATQPYTPLCRGINGKLSPPILPIVVKK